MKQLIITKYGVSVKTRKATIIIESKKEGKILETPVSNIEQLIIASSGVSITSKTIRNLIDHGVDIVFLDNRGNPTGRIYPVYINKTVETRRKQYEASHNGKGLEAAAEIIKAKILNQAGLIKRYYYYTGNTALKQAYTEIAQIAGKIILNTPSQHEAKQKLITLEAEAARAYWPAYASLIPSELGFNNRDQDGEDPVNKSLNYLYGILYSECWRAVVLAGLDPYLGFLHTDRSGNPTLVFDFIEQWRFTADMTLLAMLRHGWKPTQINGLLDYETRSKLVENLSKTLDETRANTPGETPTTLRQALKKTAFKLAAYLRGEEPFKPYIHSW